MNKITFFVLLVFVSLNSNAKKIYNEFSLGLAYTPKASFLKISGSDKKVLFSRGFISIQPSYQLMYKINKAHSVGLCLSLVTNPWYYYYNTSGTNFSLNHPQTSKKSNTQSSNLSLDLGITYRKNFIINDKLNLFSSLTPNVKLNLTQDLKQGGLTFDKIDTLKIYEVNLNEYSKFSSSLNLSFGLIKYTNKVKYIGIGLYGYYAFQKSSGTYYTMLNEPEYSSGTINHKNYQIGLKFFIGL